MSTRTRPASRGAIATRIVSATLFAFVFLIGCQTVSQGAVHDWAVRPFDAPALVPVSPNLVDDGLVDRLVADYRKAPNESSYSELTLSRVYFDLERTETRYFVFDIRYADDATVVYVLDSRDVVIDKFLSSHWMRR